MLCHVAIVRTNISEDHSASIIRVKKIGSRHQLLVMANVVPSSLILVTLMMEVLCSLQKRPFLEEPHGVASQRMAFFIVTAVKTSNLTSIYIFK
jgi:hypothetical protein